VRTSRLKNRGCSHFVGGGGVPGREGRKTSFKRVSCKKRMRYRGKGLEQKTRTLALQSGGREKTLRGGLIGHHAGFGDEKKEVGGGGGLTMSGREGLTRWKRG